MHGSYIVLCMVHMGAFAYPSLAYCRKRIGPLTADYSLIFCGHGLASAKAHLSFQEMLAAEFCSGVVYFAKSKNQVRPVLSFSVVLLVVLVLLLVLHAVAMEMMMNDGHTYCSASC